MAEIKVGYRAIFYFKDGEKPLVGKVVESYDLAEKSIEEANEKANKFDVNLFTHAKIEKVYYRH